MSRNKYDYYPTPKYCIMPMLRRLSLVGVRTFLEPCKGSGVIIEEFEPLIDTCHCRELQEGLDYLDWTPKIRYDLIVTNPPFTLAMEFLEKSLSEADVVIYLLRLDMFGSKERSSFWKQYSGRMSHLMTLSKRPSFTKDKKTDMYNYGWFVFDPNRLVVRQKQWLIPL